jgi:predicted transposase YbfD/YdcC
MIGGGVVALACVHPCCAWIAVLGATAIVIWREWGRSSGAQLALAATALSGVPDPRARRGVRHQMSTIVAVALCAVLAGVRSFTAIGEWAANASQQVLTALGAGAGPPSESCVRRTLQNLEGERLDALLGQWTACHTSGFGGRRAVAVDGKTMRGFRSPQGPARHLMAAIDHHAGVVIGQVDVPGKTNEIPIFSQLCDQIPDLEQVVVTADAMHCQKTTRTIWCWPAARTTS